MYKSKMSDYNESVFLPGSSHSSFSSDSSSCGKISNTSSQGLRRSTMDLSDLDSSSLRLSQKSLPSKQSSSFSSRMSSSEGITKEACSSGRQLPSRRDFEVRRKYHRGIEAIVQDTFLDTLQVIDVATAFSNLLSKLFDKKQHGDSMTDVSFKHNQRSNKEEETKVDDDTFSPCQIHITNAASDDWDHFADFHDRIDEKVVAFTPFAAAHKSKGKLDTLDELEEEEDECLDAFSF